MKLQGQISLLINQDSTTITIYDEMSSSTVCEVTLTPEQLSMALSRLGHTPCSLTVYEKTPERWGKTMENKNFTFVLPPELARVTRDSDALKNYAKTVAPDGWVADAYFGSQNSFFTNENNEPCARMTIRRWV